MHFRPIHGGFLRTLNRMPEAPAVDSGHRVLTFEEMGYCSAELASRLIEVGGGDLSRVGILAARGAAAYIAVLASVRAGAAFVPIVASAPPRRIRGIIETAELDILVVTCDEVLLVQQLSTLGRIPPVLVVPEDLHSRADVLFSEHEEFPRAGRDRGYPSGIDQDGSPDGLAYIMFTSGSTGEPKGVCVTNANVRSFLDAALLRYPFSPFDRMSQTFELGFDLAVFDLLMSWETGACLVPAYGIDLLAPTNFVRSRRITSWFSVPSVARMALSRHGLRPDSMPDLNWSLFCGERLTRDTAVAWQAAAPNSILENLYGPTEATIACAAYRWDASRSPGICENNVVPIGEMFPGMRAQIRPIGPPTPAVSRDGSVRGELVVEGAQVARGYWRRPDLTGEKFDDMREEADGRIGRAHYTGDVVERRGDLLVHAGRTDDQVKMRGHRLHLAEVELAILSAGAAEVVVVPWPSAEDCEYLVAFITGADTSAVKAQLDDGTLPRHLRPRELIPLDHLPLTSNGKTDRASLRRVLLTHMLEDAKGRTR